MSKENYEISRQMQDDIVQAYIKVSGKAWTMMDAFQKAVRQPAPRYYVSPKQAHQIVSRMIKGDFSLVNLMHENKQRMYYSLLEKVIQLSEQRDFIGKSLWYIMPFAVTSQAPEFFISPKHFGKIRKWIKSGAINEDGKPIPVKTRKLKKRKK